MLWLLVYSRDAGSSSDGAGGSSSNGADGFNIDGGGSRKRALCSSANDRRRKGVEQTKRVAFAKEGAVALTASANAAAVALTALARINSPNGRG